MGHAIKRLIDFAVSAAGLVMLTPLLGAVFVAIHVKMGSPALFCQTRSGRHGKSFTLYKFRTICNPRNDYNDPSADGQTIHPFGKFLRITSLDELPQLFNVLKGDMSLVGPRPLLPRYLPYFSAHENLRHLMKPGITGLAQVKGRNLLSWNYRLGLDIWYVKNWSVFLDIQILAATLYCVLSRKGIVVNPGEGMLSLDQERASSGLEVRDA